MVCSRGESHTHHLNPMKFFNVFAAAAVIGASFIAGIPAEARSTNCYFGGANQTLTRQVCNVIRRVNHNGHTVFDIRGPIKATVVLWDDNSGEVIIDGRVNRQFITNYEGNGFYRMINRTNDYNFVFKAV